MKQFSDDEFDAALVIIANSKNSNIKNLLQPPLPGYYTLRYRSRKDAAFGGRFQQALRDREGSVYHASDSLDRAMAEIQRDPSQTLRSVSLKTGIGLGHLYEQARKSEAYAKLIEARATKRHKRQAELAAQRAVKYREQRRRPTMADNILRAALLRNDLFRQADRAVPRSLLPHQRDDMRSDLVLAMLSGELDQGDLAAAIKPYRKRFNRENRLFFMDSLDAPRFREDGRETMADGMTSDYWTHEAA